MADPNTRTGKRTPVTLKIKFKSETLEQFIERYAVDVSQGGIFIRTKEPLAVGTQMRFEFQLRDASPLIGGEGTVVWTRENDPSRPAIAPGMGVRFDRLAEGSQGVLERILSEKAKQSPNRPASDSIKPPLFTDQPTRVAPAPLQEQLLAAAPKAQRRPDDYNDQHTPLPKPMPFHSDADEFPDEAFEEATKVRALDELVAQTAEPSQQQAEPPPDELAVRRGGRLDPTTPEPRSPFGDAESAPGLPSPPELDAHAGAKGGRLLDTTPSPRSEPRPTPAPPLPVQAESLGAKTKLGLEAPRMQAPAAIPLAGGASAQGPGPSMGGPMSHASGGSSPARAVAAESTAPVRRTMPTKRGSGAAVAILILVVLAASAAGVWFFVLREKAADPTPGGGSQPVATGSDTGSGSAPAAGSGSQALAAGSGRVEPPKGPLVDTVIDSSVPNARIEVVGSDQRGDAPFTAKLEKDKPYKVRVSAPGHASLEIDVIGGAPKHTAALVPKPRIISLKTDPPGALVSVDGVIAKLTPSEFEVVKPTAPNKPIRIRMTKKGYKTVDTTLRLDAFVEDDARMIATVEQKLTAQAVVVRPPPGGGSQTGSAGSGEGSGTPAGSGTTPGEGSATTPPPPPPPPPPPEGGGAKGSGEPEPSFEPPPAP